MKEIGYIVLLLLCWTCRGEREGFIVRGKIGGYPGTKLFVREMIPGNDAWMNDTLEVKDGEFIWQGRVESPRLVYFVPEDFRGRYELFLENSVIKLEAVYGHSGQFWVSGSKSHDEYLALTQKSAGLIAEYKRYEDRKTRVLKNCPEQYPSLADSSEIWSGRLLAFLQQQDQYARSMVLPYFASEWLKTEDITGMESFLNGLAAPARNSVYSRYCEQALQQEKRVQPGNPAYDFTLQDTIGKTYRLSDYRRQYVLLEFSASWCGWCKLEIPYLKKVYELSRGKNFVLFTINLDKERKLWVDDVAKENLPWPVLSDLHAFDSELTRQYNVRGIPVIFLISPEGKIVTHKLRGEQMIRYISDKLNLSYEAG